MNALMRLSNVSKRYGDKLVFANVSLSLRKGILILLAGRNGAGKTTLLRIAAGLSSPDSGTVTRESGTRLGYLGHSPFLYAGLSALENLKFWSKINKNPLSKPMEALKRVNLAAYAHEDAGFFSRGMAQRLNFARILDQSPDILLLDEPFTGLDPQSRLLIENELVRLKTQGSAMLMVSHDMVQDNPLADEAVALEKHGLAPIPSICRDAS